MVEKRLAYPQKVVRNLLFQRPVGQDAGMGEEIWAVAEARPQRSQEPHVFQRNGA